MSSRLMDQGWLRNGEVFVILVTDGLAFCDLGAIKVPPCVFYQSDEMKSQRGKEKNNQDRRLISSFRKKNDGTVHLLRVIQESLYYPVLGSYIISRGRESASKSNGHIKRSISEGGPLQATIATLSLVLPYKDLPLTTSSSFCQTYPASPPSLSLLVYLTVYVTKT